MKKKNKKQILKLVPIIILIAISFILFGYVLNDLIAENNRIKKQLNENNKQVFPEITFEKHAENAYEEIDKIYNLSSIKMYNVTYNNITISVDNETKTNQIIELLSTLNYTAGVNEIIFYSNINICYGVIFNDEKIILWNCNKTIEIRNNFITKKRWLPFVFFHEFGHAVLYSGNECHVDQYAREAMRNIKLSPIVTDESCIEEGMDVVISGINNATIVAGTEKSGRITIEIYKDD